MRGFFCLFFFVYSAILAAQGIRLQVAPTNYQLFPRDVRTNQATVLLSGAAARTSRFEQVRIKIFKENILLNTQEKALVYTSDSTKFDFSIKIQAELANYGIQIFGVTGNVETKVWAVEKIVAGDVYLINGQSNAEGRAAVFPTDIDEFSRSYTFENGWNLVQRSLPGQWGGRFAKRIIEEQKIPVAIFNQAAGGQMINFYLRNDAAPVAGNYGTLLQRLAAAGVQRAVRGAFWFHGEADGWQTTTEDYKTRFLKLHTAWKQDFGVARSIIFQMRQGSCTAPSPRVAEAHRQLAAENTDILTLSTLNAAHDSCHFDYENGYKTLAERLFQLVANEFYGRNFAGARSPDVSAAYWRDSVTIVVKMKTNGASLQAIGNPFQYCAVEGDPTATLKSATVLNDQIVFSVVKPSSRITGISYIGHPGRAAHWIVTPTNGNSILSFYNFPVQKTAPQAPNTGGDDILFKIVENPIREYLKIDYKNLWNTKEIQLEIFDILGRQIESATQKITNAEGRFDYSLNGLADGHYFLKISIPNQKFYKTLKFSIFNR
jgi:hypothetical protein